MPAETAQDGQSNVSPNPRAPRQSCLAVGLGAASAILLMLVLLGLWVGRDRMPVLSRSDFDAAWQQWEFSGPKSYRIKIKVDGPQPATYVCTVANGAIVSATRNDRPLTDQRTLGTWSVPGMFDTMEYDVEAVEGKNRTEAERAAIDLVLRAEFDATFGYPRRYMRSDFNMKTTMVWEVVEFQNISDSGRDNVSAAKTQQ